MILHCEDTVDSAGHTSRQDLLWKLHGPTDNAVNRNVITDSISSDEKYNKDKIKRFCWALTIRRIPNKGMHIITKCVLPTVDSIQIYIYTLSHSRIILM
jgi:hypothetical protein